jgi:type II secretory pathway component PulJ
VKGGFTLLEAIVALVILEIGVLAVVGMVTVASRTLNEAQTREWGTAAASAVADSLAHFGFAGPGEDLSELGRVRWEGSPAGSGGLVRVRIRSAPSGGGSAVTFFLLVWGNGEVADAVGDVGSR